MEVITFMCTYVRSVRVVRAEGVHERGRAGVRWGDWGGPPPPVHVIALRVVATPLLPVALLLLQLALHKVLLRYQIQISYFTQVFI